MARVIIAGEPGETYTNTTGKVAYQFLCDWKNTCGQCAQFDHQVGPTWPIPLHRGCKCRQIAIWPGDTSRPFTDFRVKIDSLPDDQRAKVVGASNIKLIESGTVTWEDVVTGQRVRDLREVAATKRLSVDAMTAAGVSPRVARQAYETVHTPAHELAAQKRAELVGKILDKGTQKDALRAALAEKLAARVGIGSGPSGTTAPTAAPTPATAPKAKAKPKPRPLPVSMPVTASERADYLLKAKVKPAVVAEVIAAEAPPPPAWKPRPQSEFTAFGSAKDMEAFGRESFGAWADNLSQQDKNAIKLYAQDNYKWMNAILRGQDPATVDLPHGLSAQGARDYIARTIAPLARGQVDRDIVAYRGVKSLDAMGIDPAKLVPGQELTAEGFLSSTLKRDKANDFAVGNVGPEASTSTRAILQYNIPKGSSGGYLNAAELSGYGDERELLMPPAAKFKFVRRGGTHKDVWGNEVPVLVFERVE